MAARHAAITSAGQDLTIRDLESPGGTFVNRQRLLSGQSRRLQAGDVIQLGAVQLEVKHQAAIVGAYSTAQPVQKEPTRPQAPAAADHPPRPAPGVSALLRARMHPHTRRSRSPRAASPRRSRLHTAPSAGPGTTSSCTPRKTGGHSATS